MGRRVYEDNKHYKKKIGGKTMFGKKKLLNRKQIKAICAMFKCRKNDFVSRRFEDGFLLTLKNKEYKVKFTEGFHTKIVYAKEMKRTTKKI